MAARMKQGLSSLVQKLDVVRHRLVLLEHIISGKYPPPALAVAASPTALSGTESQQTPNGETDLKSIFDGFMLAVPRARRTIETRLRRKMAFTGYFEHAWKKRNIVPCLECGNFKEKGHLCLFCYEKVRAETKEMQAKMGDDLKFKVPQSEVVFVYEGDAANTEGKHVVSMNKQRPSWFPKQLLNKTGV
ncbi:39S ribosomal protein L32, mitochondrial [Aplysia californica]|uniref:Large ribosomal subunit protein bL32m n=1 Tax=Aplysia californica TaxID=6500 RepID=A0ABM0KA15_APLCA|nr:39S ribosomal protein L32, mitochondrial [Aplysia californica]